MGLIHKMIPENYVGSKSGATQTSKLPNRSDAIILYKFARYKLLDVNNWYKICHKKGSEFFITDIKGNHLMKTSPDAGDLIKIKLPAPKRSTGDGYDWVKVEEIFNEKDLTTDEEVSGFIVRPTQSPFNTSLETDHFYKSSATSTFLIHRKDKVVTVMERGRNEVPNVEESWMNTFRNLFVALGAMMGLSKPQWQVLVNHILNI